jgi:signal transduction histidine kinase
MDQFTQADGLSDDSVTSLFEDREGNIWVATDNGLDRFREFAVPTISVQQGLSSRGVFSVLASREGSIWLGASDGVNRWNKGQITVYHKRSVGPQARGFAASIGTDSKRTVREITDSGLPGAGAECLFEDNHGQIWVGTRKGVAIFRSDRFFPVASVPYGIVYSIIADHAGDIWISHEQGLLHLIQTRVVERIPWAKLGRNEPATALLPDPRQDGLWLGFRDGGAAYFKDGEIRASFARTEGLAEGWVRSFYSDGSGSLWVAAEGGLSRLKDGRVLTLTSQNGLPCNTVQWMMEDDADSVWLYTACGLVRVARSELDAWVSHPTQTIRATVLDTSDGITSHRFTGGFSANVAKSADGKLWFLPVGGVSVLDPHHLAFNKIPPPVHIEQVTADGRNYDVSNGLRLPSGVSDLLFDFTALSFVKPEKVRIRVKLEGQDKTWRELVNQRRVQYTNLPPRAYRFRVLACNESGVCNEEGDFLDFSIAPAFYQRTSFRVLGVLVFLGALFAAYRLRVRQLAHQFNKTLDVRVSERTRIARDLHDTLLQSFQGLLLKFQSVLNVLPANPDEARQRLNLAIDQAAEAITEGRNAVQGLRSSAFESNDLAIGIIAIGQELTDDGPTAAPTIDVEVEGAPRDLNPIVRDEAYRIAGEALRNAFQHAQALRITVEIRYDRRQFRLRVRDDGKGIDEATLRQGHAGHFGLHGMRERAEIVGGRLEVWSKDDAGTEVELSIPGGVAYVVERSWFSKVFSGRSRNKESTQP